jgi:uncharacterized protein YbbK (DUF523 family)
MLDVRTLAGLYSSDVVSACPEVLGGLGIPRTPCEIPNGDGRSVLDGRARVKSKEGVDRTKEYVRGAERALAIIQQTGVSEIFLCDYSPSCGSSLIYDGTFSDTKRDGMGVFAALLAKNGYGPKLHSVRPGPSA